MATVQSLHVHPVKSCRAVDCGEAVLGPRGFLHDREWLVIDESARFVTERTHPELACVTARVVNRALTLTASGQPPLSVPFDDAGARFPVTVWRDRCVAADQGDEAARWFSAILGKSVRLMRLVQEMQRHADPAWAGGVPVATAFQDGFPLLVCNRASLDDLNRRLPEPLPMARFRPNVVLDGLEPWEEDRIAALEVGAVRLALVKPCTRCVITATDHLSGERSLDPLPVLRTFRYNRALAGVIFGENAVIASGMGASIRCGDSVRVVHD
jgi:uncharacterized protein